MEQGAVDREDATLSPDPSRSGGRPAPDLYQELRHLRNRRGVERPDLGNNVGPALRQLSNIQPSDSEPRIRLLVQSTLRGLIDSLPPDLAQAATLAFALDKAHRYPSLNERIKHLADVQKRSERTARRMMDQAISAMVGYVEDRPAVEAAVGPGWRVSSLDALFRLDTPTPELYEIRTIVATRELSEVTVRLSLPPARDPGKLEVAALFGARVTTVDQPNPHSYRVNLALPRTLQDGDQHEFWIRVALPSGQPTWTHYAIVPLDPCKSGTVRVRFSPARLPLAVWLLNEIPYIDLRTPYPGQAPVELDRNGEVAFEFAHLREGYGYGFAWTEDD